MFDRGSVLNGFKDEVADFKTSKGTIRFPLNKRLRIGLITRIVKARVEEVERRTRR